jgi:arsenite-transporting ATPase
VFFAGKGGVGKTTAASVYALVRARAGEGVLLVSTDPAHSLGDALGASLSGTPKRVRRSLEAVELDAQRAFARWLNQHRRPLGDILEHGTWLDRDDVDALLELSVPGVDELMGIIEIDRLAGRSRHDVVVVDTAPTGHMLRLLSAPQTVSVVADVLGVLQREHRLIREQLARVGRPEAADRLIATLAAQARDIAGRLRDPTQTDFVWITLAEELSVRETADGIAALARAGMAVGEIVVNRVQPRGAPCPVCDRQLIDQDRAIARIGRRFGRGRIVRVMNAALKEPRGLRALATLGRNMADGSWLMAEKPKSIVRQSLAISHQRLAMSADATELFAGASLLFFGGKGGVGKTTVAAAVAVRLARADSRRRVLLLSTDPAHSLGDVFGVDAGDRAQAVRGAPANLVVRELDAAKAFADRRARFEGAVDEIAAAIGVEGAGEALGASGLMDLAPPGIDELFGILSVVESRAAYDAIVIDTAPTGHALRLLETPAAARAWTQVLLRMLLKYRSLVRPGQLAEELVAVSKSIRALIDLMRDARTTRFIVVTRAAELPRLETTRLLSRLARLHLLVPAIVVNARTLGPGGCLRCRAIAARERRELDLLRRVARRRCVIIQTPLSAPPPRGAKALEGWSRTWV